MNLATAAAAAAREDHISLSSRGSLLCTHTHIHPNHLSLGRTLVCFLKRPFPAFVYDLQAYISDSEYWTLDCAVNVMALDVSRVIAHVEFDGCGDINYNKAEISDIT